MAVTFFNANATAGPASAAARTLLHTATVGAVLLVWTHNNEAVTTSAVAAGTNALTRLVAISAGTSRLELWGLSSVPTGTLTISAAPVGGNVATWCLAAASYTGQRQLGGSPFGTVVAGTATTATLDISVSSTTADVVAFGFGISANTTLTLNNGNTRASATHSTTGRLVIGDIAGAATVSLSATAGAGTPAWGYAAVPIVASATAASTTLAFDNAASTHGPAIQNTLGMLLTATSGAVLMVWGNVGAESIESINVGAVSMTQLTAMSQAAGATGLNHSLWILTAPATGVLTISAVLAGGAIADWCLYGVTYVGQRTTATPFGGAVVQSGSTSAIEVSVSSTAGNLVIAGFGQAMFNPVSVSVGTEATVRLSAISFPSVLVMEIPGMAAVTAVAKASSAIGWGVIAINLIQSGAASFISGIAAMTDPADIFSASGYVLINGRLSATDAQDRFSLSAKVLIQGRLSATDVVDKLSASGYALIRNTAGIALTMPADTLSASGYVLVSGRLSATDAQDRLSASGYTLLNARLSATDAQDRLSASGYVLIQGLISATDVTDKFSASGYVVNTANVNGTIAFTDSPDTFSGSAYVLIQGSINCTDQPDTCNAPGYNASAPPEAPATAGHGHPQKEYFRADEAFWTAREKYLRSIHKQISAEPEVIIDIPPTARIVNTNLTPIDPVPLLELRAARSKVISAMPAATSMRQLRPLGKRLYEINARIAEQKRQQLLAETVARLRQEREDRSKARQRTIRKAKRKVVMLAAVRAISALNYLYTKK